MKKFMVKLTGRVIVALLNLVITLLPRKDFSEEDKTTLRIMVKSLKESIKK